MNSDISVEENLLDFISQWTSLIKTVLILITLLQPYENLTALQGIMAFWDCFHCWYFFLIAVLIIVREASCFPGALKLPSGPDRIYFFITQGRNFRTLSHIWFVFCLFAVLGKLWNSNLLSWKLRLNYSQAPPIIATILQTTNYIQSCLSLQYLFKYTCKNVFFRRWLCTLFPF